jgi:outer membrane murein-binding lipoprotein Lpp
VAGTELQVDVLTLPAITGTIDLGATDNAVLDAIATNTTGLNGCVAGTELQVDVLTLPAITGTIDLGATDNAVLDTIATNTSHLSDNLDTLSAQLPSALSSDNLKFSVKIKYNITYSSSS